jgi:hypothetical protein
MIREFIKTPKFTLIGSGVAIVCLLVISAYSSQKSNEAEKLSNAMRSQMNGKSGSGSAQKLTPVEQFKELMAFERGMQRFIREQADMAPDERNRQAKILLTQLDQREKSRYVSAGEALNLRIALIRATEPDEEKQALQIAELIARYKTVAERRQTQFVAEQAADPKFQAYKTREAQIVAEVEAMRSFPSGVSRDEYLRQRLLEARAAIYYKPEDAQPATAPTP